MPLPFIIGGALLAKAAVAAAVVAGAGGVAAGVHGAKKMKDANDTIDAAKHFHQLNQDKLQTKNTTVLESMDRLGKKELEIFHSFEKFSLYFELIQNKPEFQEYSKNGISIPKYNASNIKEVSIGAEILLGTLGGATLGTAGAFAAAGITTATVTAIGTASTGTAIASLSGAAATKALLAALGGGSIAAGGGGIALGTAVLGASTLGIGLLVGGIVFNVVGSSLSDKADEAWKEVKRAEVKIIEIIDYLSLLNKYSRKFEETILRVEKIYREHLEEFCSIIKNGKNDWNSFSEKEKLITENTVLLVGLLYEIGKVQLVLVPDNQLTVSGHIQKSELNEINKADINSAIEKSNSILNDYKVQLTTQI